MAFLGLLEISKNILKEDALPIRIPDGTVFSFPTLVRREGRLLDAVFLYCPPEDGRYTALRPFAWVMLECASGRVALFSDCKAVDFADTAAFPLDGEVSMAPPNPVEAGQYDQAGKDLHEAYEQLRLYAFEPDPADWQLETMDAYRSLFLRLAPVGHYPFYAALAPEFFGWLHLKLVPERLDEAPPRPSSDSPAEARSERTDEAADIQTLLAEVRDLGRLLQEGAGRDKLLDEMHAELSAYRGGLVEEITAEMESGVIKVIDDMERSVEAYLKKNTTKLNFRKLVTLLDGFRTDLCDLLYCRGLEPFRVEGQEVDIQQQKILAVQDTHDPALDKKVACRHAPGWLKDGKLKRPERISVYVYSPPPPEDPPKAKRH